MNSDRATQLAKLLKELRESSKGYFPDEIWLEIHKTFALPYVELVIPRKAGDQWEIFLVRRPRTDPYWPSMWHLPGGLWRTKQTEVEACEAIAKRELGISVSRIKEVMSFKWTTHPYGRPISHVCLCQPNGKLRAARDRRYFPRLPRQFIPEQVTFVKDAIKYLNEQSSRLPQKSDVFF